MKRKTCIRIGVTLLILVLLFALAVGFAHAYCLGIGPLENHNPWYVNGFLEVTAFGKVCCLYSPIWENLITLKHFLPVCIAVGIVLLVAIVFLCMKGKPEEEEVTEAEPQNDILSQMGIDPTQLKATLTVAMDNPIVKTAAIATAVALPVIALKVASAKAERNRQYRERQDAVVALAQLLKR